MRKQKLKSMILGVTLLILQSSLSGFAQSTTGAIAGIVADQQQGVVPGASVTVKHLETNATHTAATDSEGRFRFPSLPVGTYQMTVQQKGFARYVRSGITLTLNQEAQIDVMMQPSGVKEVVNILADVSLLNKTNAELGVRFESRRISELPLAPNRDVVKLVLSAPGVSQLSTGNTGLSFGGVTFSVNGMRTRSNNFMIDGQDSNDPYLTGFGQALNNPDLIQEVRLITNQFLPEFGRAAGSVVNIITRGGTNDIHGSAFWFHNDNSLNSRNNLDKALVGGRPMFASAPFRIENQIGGTVGGPVRKDRTFYFGSFQWWTDRQLGSSITINGVPTEQGRQLLQQLAGSRPQVQALLKFLPAAQAPIGRNATVRVGSQTIQVPLGSLSGSSNLKFDDSQWSARVDHRFNEHHSIGGRYLWTDHESNGAGQTAPPGLTSANTRRQQAATLFLTSTLTPRLLSEFRISYQRIGGTQSSSDKSSEEIPSIEISELGLTGFNASATRTAIGLAANLPTFRFLNTYQLQETISYTTGPHALKGGIDLRRNQTQIFSFLRLRGLLRYPTLQRFVDDVAEAAQISKPLPGGDAVQNSRWYDLYTFFQDEWRVRPDVTLTYGIRYEAPGNSVLSLLPVSKRIVAAAGGDKRFGIEPIPHRDKNNVQPRVGFSWNPRTESGGPLGLVTGGDKLVLRGGYSRTNDYAFLNITQGISAFFPFVAAINRPGLQNAFTTLPTLTPTGLDPNTLTRATLGADFRAPNADQYLLQIQRELSANLVLSVGYVGTKGTGLFQTIDGNPRLRNSTQRVDPTRGVIRLWANAASSIYHSLQVSLERRLARGLSAGAHYTRSTFIDDASDIFNASVSGDVAVSQDSFNRRADRARSTYDRPHRFAANFVWELPFFRKAEGALRYLLDGWQVNSFVTLQSGAPFSVLNGEDPCGALAGIDGVVGNAIRPSLNTSLNLSRMSVEEINRAGGARLFRMVTGSENPGSAGEFGQLSEPVGDRRRQSQDSARPAIYLLTFSRRYGLTLR
jgi:Carboxypeptidase regulatory-like domain